MIVSCYTRLQPYFGQAKTEQQELIGELLSKIKETSEPPHATVAKLNLFLTQISLVSLFDQEFAQKTCKWAIEYLTLLSDAEKV